MIEKKYVAGLLVITAAGAALLQSMIQGDIVPDSRWGVSCAPAWVIFDQKKRCGFVDLGELVTAKGFAVRTKIHNDGDFSVNIVLDQEFRRLLCYEGNCNRDYLHVEFMPCERTYSDVEPVLQEVARRLERGLTTRVMVTGRWAYDGVDHNGAWREQLDTCLSTRSPDPEVGWTEIHPAYAIDIIE